MTPTTQQHHDDDRQSETTQRQTDSEQPTRAPAGDQSAETAYRMLAVAVHHPDPVNPYIGLFNGRALKSMCQRDDIAVDAISPRPFAPPIGPYSEYRTIPQIEHRDGYDLHHPRFFYGLPKRLFYGLSGRSFAKRVSSYVEGTFELPDVVHAYHIYIDGYGMLPYCREHDLPLFVVAHGAALNGFDEFGSGVQSKIRETLEAAERVFCVSDALAQRATAIADADTTVVPIGADPANFPTGETTRLRQERDIDESDPVVLFCGQYVERKGLREIIEVLPTLDAEDARFVFVGQDGPQRKPLEQTVTEAGLEDRVNVFHDVPSDELREWFAIADLLMLPSHNEGRPTVIYEAMASETAVLGSTAGGIPEQVVDDETGVIVPPGDPDRLARELEALVADRSQLQRMGSNGYDRLQSQGWTWRGHAERVAEIHRSYVATNR